MLMTLIGEGVLRAKRSNYRFLGKTALPGPMQASGRRPGRANVGSTTYPNTVDFRTSLWLRNLPQNGKEEYSCTAPSQSSANEYLGEKSWHRKTQKQVARIACKVAKPSLWATRLPSPMSLHVQYLKENSWRYRGRRNFDEVIFAMLRAGYER